MKKIILFIFLLSSFFVLPVFVIAVEMPDLGEERMFAEILKIEEESVRVQFSDGRAIDIDQSIESGQQYQLHVGDKVVVNKIIGEDGGDRYFIVDFVRKIPVYLLLFLFFAVIIFFLRGRGVKALVSLSFHLLLIVFVLVPLILKGWNPLLVTIVISSLAYVFTTYFTYGKNEKSHATVLATITAITFGALLSYVFVKWASLTGFVAEEATFIISLGYTDIDMRGLLLAAIIIGALGVLDDVCIGQVSVVNELKKSNPNLNNWELYRRAMVVGRDHTTSMVNTLLFAYIGASFPLFILFTLRQPPFDNLASILNNEIVATEIVRTLVGSISLVLAVPLTTALAVWFYSRLSSRTK